MRARKSLRLISVAAVICTAGCQATGTIFTEADTPPEGRSLVYIYQMPDTYAPISTTEIVVDGKSIATLRNDSYTYFYLSSGSHRITEEPGTVNFAPDKSIDTNVPAGETIYIVLTRSLTQEGNTLMIGAVFAINRPEQGRLQIRRRHFEPAANSMP